MKTMPSRGSIFAFSRKRREVMMALMPHCAMAPFIAASPRVKFRFTGTLPAKDRPTFTSAPAVEAGSNTPTICPSGRSRRNRRDRASDPTSALPKVRLLPVESRRASARQ